MLDISDRTQDSGQLRNFRRGDWRNFCTELSHTDESSIVGKPPGIRMIQRHDVELLTKEQEACNLATD